MIGPRLTWTTPIPTIPSAGVWRIDQERGDLFMRTSLQLVDFVNGTTPNPFAIGSAQCCIDLNGARPMVQLLGGHIRPVVHDQNWRQSRRGRFMERV